MRLRGQSNQATLSSADDSTPISPNEARQKLRHALLDVQKHAGSYVNISKLQLAIRGLDQPPGQETIRIAILGLADGGISLRVAKQLLKAVIADPLKQEEEWERILLQPTSENKALLLKVGSDHTYETLHNRLVTEINISWPKMNGNNLEILILETDLARTEATIGEKMALADALLVPTMEIPSSNAGRYTPVTTPVHKALVVGNGFEGAISLMALHVDRGIVNSVTNLRLHDGQEDLLSLGIQVVDVEKALNAIQSFRQDLGNAMGYEQGWFESRVNIVSEWLADETSATDTSMKLPVRNLIESLLNNTLLAIQSERLVRMQDLLSAKISSSDMESLRSSLSQWAERAHTELRDQLDIAFKGRRWRKLGWWKLFWRVDDVSMITSDMLNQRFLNNAEKESIFLSGRFQQTNIVRDHPLVFGPQAYRYEQEPVGPGPPPPTIQGLIETPNDEVPVTSEPKPWPLDIPATRTLLSTNTVPALQALAQKLVFQTLTTSAFASALAGLMYFSSLTTTVYEAGAVIALGTVWSLRRMQGKWETARKFWEGEVREEGRKAVRETESSLGSVLLQKDNSLEGFEEQDAAEKFVKKAQAALNTCK